MRSQKIEAIKRKYHREWLLIAVDQVDESTTTPISGRVIAHSPQRNAIYKKLSTLKRQWPILVEYSEDSLPKGVVAAFLTSIAQV